MTGHQGLYSLSMNSAPNSSLRLNCAFFTVRWEIAFLNNTGLPLHQAVKKYISHQPSCVPVIGVVIKMFLVPSLSLKSCTYQVTIKSVPELFLYYYLFVVFLASKLHLLFQYQGKKYSSNVLFTPKVPIFTTLSHCPMSVRISKNLSLHYQTGR